MSNMFTEADIVYAVYIAVPAYIANSVPPIFGGGIPIDFGRVFIDGKRIFGANKTFRGLLTGLFFGSAATFAMGILVSLELLGLGLLASTGALLGDLFGAFIKRRLGFEPGAPFPLLDQLDFIFGALAFTYPIYNTTFGTALILLIFTPPIHLLANFVAYRLGLKRNWW
ncbi:MAG: CDP-2,3-bis-(O-geranylgeranyl)-sn-glycerol synthase [Candidatus Bathyarchaeia archaeon]